jgi:hypothetical protein
VCALKLGARLMPSKTDSYASAGENSNYNSPTDVQKRRTAEPNLSCASVNAN